MDLSSFVKPKTKKESKIIKKDSEISILEEDEKISFNIKTKKALETHEKYLFFAPTNSIIPKTPEQLEQFFKQSIADNVEGVMVKSLDAKYMPGHRTGAMAKLKETKEDIDVVILGAEYGTGKRAGFYSSFIVAVKNYAELAEDEPYVIVGKVSSGIKELEDSQEGVSMQKITELLKPLKLSEEKNVVYFEPKVVIQVRYQEIQKSVAYNSGFALRFPRIITLREDKSLDEINSVEDIARFAGN